MVEKDEIPVLNEDKENILSEEYILTEEEKQVFEKMKNDLKQIQQDENDLLNLI